MLSRVASSLYWMSRYLERVEHTARVIDVNVVLMLDQAPADADLRWERLMRALYLHLPDSAPAEPQRIVQALLFDRNAPHSLLTMLAMARDNARQVRNQLSSEMWEQVNQMYLELSRSTMTDIWSGEAHALFRDVKESVQLFHGITEATMRRDEGWHFMRIGRFAERAEATIALLNAYFSERDRGSGEAGVNRDYLDLMSLLKSRTAFEAYCQVYTADLQPERIAAFLLLSATFPHSVRFSAEQIHTALLTIAEETRARHSEPINRRAGRIRATLDYEQIDEIMERGLLPFLQDVRGQFNALHGLLSESYFQPPLQTVLSW